MSRRAPLRTMTLVRNDGRNWGAQTIPWVCLGIAAGVVVLTVSGPVLHSLFRQGLGGPEVVFLGGQLRSAVGWTWFLVGTLFVVMATGVIDTADGWTDLAVARGVPRRRLAAARLVVLAVGSVVYAVALLATLAVVALLPRSATFVQSADLWDVGVWVLGLVSLGWFAQALKALTQQAWPALVVPLTVLAVARYGGNVSPYVPFAQWIFALHGLPGTLTRLDGAAYLLGWTALSGAVALWMAGWRHRPPSP